MPHYLRNTVAGNIICIANTAYELVQIHSNIRRDDEEFVRLLTSGEHAYKGNFDDHETVYLVYSTFSNNGNIQIYEFVKMDDIPEQ